MFKGEDGNKSGFGSTYCHFITASIRSVKNKEKPGDVLIIVWTTLN